MSKFKSFSRPAMPLTPPIFYILLSLALKERHGYDIMKQVGKDSEGKVKLGPGTLYGAIKRMLEEKLIVEQPQTLSERRRYYALTEKGRSMLSTELKRYEEAVMLAKERRLLQPNQNLAFAYE